MLTGQSRKRGRDIENVGEFKSLESDPKRVKSQEAQPASSILTSLTASVASAYNQTLTVASNFSYKFIFDGSILKFRTLLSRYPSDIELFGENVSPEVMQLFGAYAAQKNDDLKNLEFTTIELEYAYQYFNKVKKLAKAHDFSNDTMQPQRYIGCIITRHHVIPHWIAINIEISPGKNNDFEVKLLICESITTKITMFSIRILLEAFANAFSEMNSQVYIRSDVRQNDHHTCSMFALDDMKNLIRIGSYIPDEYEGSIFKYLEDNKTDSEKIRCDSGIIEVTYAKLPLRMMRSKQSSSQMPVLIDKYKPKDKDVKVNRKGVGIQEYVDTKAFKHDERSGKKQNLLMHNKLYNMRINLGKFIDSQVDLSVIDKKSREYSLQNFLSK